MEKKGSNSCNCKCICEIEMNFRISYISRDETFFLSHFVTFSAPFLQPLFRHFVPLYTEEQIFKKIKLNVQTV